MKKRLSEYNSTQKAIGMARAKEVVRLKHAERMSFEEIGLVMKISRQRAYQLYRRATGLRNLA